MQLRRDREGQDQLRLRFPTLACAVALAFTVLMLFLLALNAFWLVERENKLIQQNLELQGLRGMLRYYDEALSMSVLMATVDPNPKWEQRYHRFDDELNTAIRRAMELAPSQAVFDVLAELDRDNHQLVSMERRCLDHIRKGEMEAARAILEDERYRQFTLEYAHGVSALATALLAQIRENAAEQKRALIASLVIVAIIITLVLVVWSVVVRYLRKWRDAVVEHYESRSRAEKQLADARERLRNYAENLEKTVGERTAELRENMQATEAFSYSMAHDLRAPARAMQGFAEALIQDYGPALDEAGREYASRILMAARRMDCLIEDLMNYATLGQEVPLHSLDPAAVLQQVLANLENEIRARSAELKAPRWLPHVVGNPTLLDLVFTNLIANALKYVAQNVQPRVEIWAEERDSNVRIFVRDNGIGIDPHDSERIFGIFQRLHTYERYSGTGVGLAIVRRAVERMRGRVGVTSTVGRGSTFWVELPKASA